MKKLIILLFIVGCSTPTITPTVIGYENDNGKNFDIISGNLSSTDVVKAYFDAYNAKDLQAVYNLEHSDVVLYAPNGMMIEGPKQHLELGEQFLEANPIANWEIVWSMSSDVKYDDMPEENWVTSGLLVTSNSILNTSSLNDEFVIFLPFRLSTKESNLEVVFVDESPFPFSVFAEFTCCLPFCGVCCEGINFSYVSFIPSGSSSSTFRTVNLSSWFDLD